MCSYVQFGQETKCRRDNCPLGYPSHPKNNGWWWSNPFINAFMKSSSKSLHVFRKPIDIVASIKTRSSTTVANKCNCEILRKSCLNARLRSILLMNRVLRHGDSDSLAPKSFVEKSKILSFILGPFLL